MAQTKQLQAKNQHRVLTTMTGSFINSGDNTVTEDGLTTDWTGDNAKTSSTTPPVTKSAMTSKAMSAGAATIDLTAMANDSDGATVDFTGLKVCCLTIKNLSTNSNKITVGKGASNGFCLDSGETTWSIALDPGDGVQFLINESTPDVASGKKTIDIAGTGSQVCEIGVSAG